MHQGHCPALDYKNEKTQRNVSKLIRKKGRQRSNYKQGDDGSTGGMAKGGTGKGAPGKCQEKMALW